MLRKERHFQNLSPFFFEFPHLTIIMVAHSLAHCLANYLECSSFLVARIITFQRTVFIDKAWKNPIWFKS